jgi:hypothetical protein
MVVRRGKPAAKKAPARRRPAAKSVPAKPARKVAAAPAKSRAGRPKMDVTGYATKAPSDYHKAFAKWAVEVVGYEPRNRKDFLMGIAIATAARSRFMQSDFLAEWREETGQAKRGPKTTDKPVTRAKAKKVESEDEEDFEDEDDFEDEVDDEEDFEDDDSDEDEDEFGDDDEEDDSEEDDDDSEDEEDDEDEWEDEEEEEPVKPAPKRRGTPAKATRSRATGNARGSRGGAAKARPKAATAKSKATAEEVEDDYIF